MYWPIDELVAAGTFKTFLSDLIALISYSRYPGLPPLLVWQQLFALLAPLPDEYPVECNATGDLRWDWWDENYEWPRHRMFLLYISMITKLWQLRRVSSLIAMSCCVSLAWLSKLSAAFIELLWRQNKTSFSTQQNRSDNRCRSCPQSWSAFCLSFCARSLWFFSMFSFKCRITSTVSRSQVTSRKSYWTYCTSCPPACPH